ncbi:MAG: hypothetical protein K5984_00090, partial [Bacteroidales bacterium]|nr:hypothetical protein [Bacteroidales bacterium]
MKKVLSVTSWVLGLIIVAVVALTMAAQTPRFQTWMARKALASLEDKLGGSIQVGSVSITPVDAVVLRDVVVLDKDPYHYEGWPVVDTIFRAKYVGATFSLKGLFNKEGLHLSRAEVRDGVFNLVMDPRGNNITRLLNSKPKEEKTEMGSIFDASRATLSNVRFVMRNYGAMERLDSAGVVRDTCTTAIRWDDMDVQIGIIKARGIKLGDGYMSGEVTEANLREKSGYELTSLVGKTRVGHGKTLVWDAEVHDLWSDILIDEYSMSYDRPSAFADYINSVRMTGELHDSYVNIKSVSYFSKSLQRFDVVCWIEKGSVEGPVADLHINELRFQEVKSGLVGNASCVLTGLPDMDKFTINANARSLSFRTSTIGDFIRGWAPQATLDLGKFAPGEAFTFKGTGHGTLNHLKLDGSLTSNVGNVRIDGLLKNIISKNSPIVISGDVDAEDVDIKTLAGVSAAGKCSAGADLTLTLNPGSPEIRIDSAIVHKAEFLGYKYTGILANGILKDEQFDGRIVCNDPNLNFIFQGIFNLSRRSQNALYKFYAMLGYADLNALNIDKRGVSKFSGARINADYLRVRKGDLLGSITIDGLAFEDQIGFHEVGPIAVSSHSNDNIHRINLNSKFLDGSYIGTKPLTSMVKSLQEASTMRELPSLYKDGIKEYDGEEYELNFNFHDSRNILSFVKPGLYVADSTAVRISLRKDGALAGNIKSHRLAIGSNYIKDVAVRLDNRDEALNDEIS